MMKKEYLKPVMKAMELRIEHVVAASAPRWEQRGGESGDVTGTGTDGGQWGNLWSR